MKNKPKTVIRLVGAGGELDRFELAGVDLTSEKLTQALTKLIAHTWMLDAGDTITITEEDVER